MPATAANVLDVRTIVPRERQPLISGTFRKLAPGDAFLLVNDHDPKPLYYQFQVAAPEHYPWSARSKSHA